MSSTHSISSEFPQARKPFCRASVGSGKQGNLIVKGDSNDESHSLITNKKSAGNEQKLDKLQEENLKLKQELDDLKIQYQQLIMERKNECFDERRVNFLKAQVMQLERQVILLAEGLNSRASFLLEIDNLLQPVLDKLRFLLANENHSSEVLVTRAELIQMIEMCQSMRQKLQRNSMATNVENLALPWMLSGIKATKDPVTLVDLCSGKMENLNLLYVSALEGKLSTLFKHLYATKQTISLILASGPESSDSAHHILPNVIYARLINHLTKCSQSLEECSRDLLVMTLIVPSAPWAKIDSPQSHDFSVENVLGALPAFPKGIPQQRAKRAAEALVKAANYSRLMASQQIHALEAEVNFHRSIYSLQIQYTEALFQGIKQAYHTFQENVSTVVCSPLKDVLSSYHNLKNEASELALRNFLSAFKTNAAQIQDAVDTLTPSLIQQHEGDEALSKLGKEFFLSLEDSLKACGEQRGKAVCKIEELKQELEQSFEILNSLKKERKEKGNVSKGDCSKSEAESTEGIGSLDHDQELSVITSHHIGHQKKHSSSKEREMSDSQSLGQKHGQKSRSLTRNKMTKDPQRPPWQD